MKRKATFSDFLQTLWVLSVFTLVSTPGCGGTSSPLFPPGLEETTIPVHIAIYSGHSGIIIKNSTMPDDLRRLTDQFNSFSYVEFGWGDHDYYQDPDPSTFVSVKAALWPTASVLHLIGINETMNEYAVGPEIYRIELSKEGFRALCGIITETFGFIINSSY